jgi:hypothetical protein
MSNRGVGLALLGLLMLLVPARPAFACSCAVVSVCSAYWDADRVFVGRAEVTPLGPGAQRTRFRIDESFVGAPGVVEIESRGIGGSCAYGFVDGTRYLVYARQSPDGKWHASICSRTASVDQASEDLRFARTVAKDSRGAGSVSGSAVIAERLPGGGITDTVPLGGATVTLRHDARVLTAETNLQGFYEFKQVPAAQYTLSIRVTPQFETVPSTTVTVKGAGACAAHTFLVTRKPGTRK